jgi:hypothetical protein
MLKTICSVLFLLSSFSLALAQQDSAKVTQASAAPLITAGASVERVRFAAPGAVVQMRLQVYADTAQMVFDATSKGNVLDWTVQDGSGERLRTGAYLCVVTVKSLGGKLGQRIGEVSVQEQQTEMRAIELAHLTMAQQREIGPVEEDAAILVLKQNEAEAATVIAHNGEDGQITRGRGALSFRIGDFFSGKDTEQMRLTEEGNLGIGTSEPKLKLDVAGIIGAREGLMFSDGSTLSVNKKGVLTHTTASGNVAPSAAGTGTQDRLAKWTDNSGTLGDSGITETPGGFLGIGTTTPQSGLDYRNGLAPFFTRDIGTTNFGTTQSALQLGVTNAGSRNAGVGPSFLFFADNSAGAKSFLGRVSGAWENPTAGAEAGSILFQVRANSGDTNALTERMRITASGNVGIGTTAPISPLHIAAPVPVLRLQDTDNAGAGQVGTVSFLNGVGDETGWIGFGASANANAHFMNNRAGGNTALGAGGVERLTVTSSGNVGVGTTSPQDKLDVRGNVKLGNSGQLYAPGGEENLRIIRGVFNTAGNIIVGSGFQVTRNGTGNYTITFNTPFAGPPAVTATTNVINRSALVELTGATGNGFSLDSYLFETGEIFDAVIHFIAIGPR